MTTHKRIENPNTRPSHMPIARTKNPMKCDVCGKLASEFALLVDGDPADKHVDGNTWFCQACFAENCRMCGETPVDLLEIMSRWTKWPPEKPTVEEVGGGPEATVTTSEGKSDVPEEPNFPHPIAPRTSHAR